ncbi:iron ABC transporter ATP-binding protein [Salinibacterium sp. ZJ454]|uniref:iron ABC transporter ATP-binding protein n=1 Tax=Salinibacterium sp. ZJ454 TaxID=2708339 RepID=UPI0014200285|nr:iron ABC transporter ATP-binding protein [Salinibacterium sp. ZJ454]
MSAALARVTSARTLLSVTVGTVLVMALAGCTAENLEASETPKPSTSATASSAPEPTESATPEPEPEPIVGVPITLSCDEVLAPQAVYDYNPNFGTDPNYAPADGSLAASIVGYSGLACGWVNQTSGETFEVAVAELPDAALDTFKNQAGAQSTMVPTYGHGGGFEGYFTVNYGVGEARVFTGSNWIVVSSTAFYEPGDAIPIVEPVVAALAG